MNNRAEVVGGFIFLFFLIALIGVGLHSHTQAEKKLKRAANLRHERAIVMCKKHEGFSHWIYESGGWGPDNRFAMCINGHKIPFGVH